MCFSKLYKLIYIWLDCFYTTLHRRNGIALTLNTNTLSHDNTKFRNSNTCSTSTVHTL